MFVIDGAREALLKNFGITAEPAAGPALQRASIVVWAVKPQTFKDAAAQAKAHTAGALHLSVAAGIRSDSIAQWLGSERIVRTMPNTPALVGKGMSAIYARPAVGAEERAQVEAILASTGEFLWVESEKQLDAVTALSGSGPAYVFYFLEAMTRAGVAMGLGEQQAHQLAVGTFVGASELAHRSDEGRPRPRRARTGPRVAGPLIPVASEVVRPRRRGATTPDPHRCGGRARPCAASASPSRPARASPTTANRSPSRTRRRNTSGRRGRCVTCRPSARSMPPRRPAALATRPSGSARRR